MGYAGYAPGMKVADQLTPLEQALRQIPTELYMVSLDIVETLCKNIAQKPSEEKFRKVKLANPKIGASVTSIRGAIHVLMCLGFSYEEVDGEHFLVLPSSVKFNFPDHVNKIIDAKDWHRKEYEKIRVQKGLSRVMPAGEKIPDTRTPAEIDEAIKAGIQYCVQVGGVASA